MSTKSRQSLYGTSIAMSAESLRKQLSLTVRLTLAPRPELTLSLANSMGMNDVSQLASAMLAIVFAAVMLIGGHLYIKSRPGIAPFTTGIEAYASRNLPDENRLLASFGAWQPRSVEPTNSSRFR
jgi:hypothetical protein